MRDSQLLDLLYDAALDSKRWLDFADALEHSLGGAAALLSLQLPERGAGRRGELVSPSLTAEFVESYRLRHHALDPWPAHARSLAVGTAVSERDGWWAAAIRGSRFEREWLQPQRLASQAFLGCVIDRDPQNGVSLLSVFRREGACAPSPGRWVLGAELVSHLRRALKLHFQRLSLQDEREALGRVLDRLPVAVMLVDARGQVHTTNRAAERLLAGRDGLALGRDGLHAADPETTQRLRRSIAEATCGSEPGCRGAPLLLSRPSGRRPLRALVRPVCARSGEAKCLAGIFVSDPDAVSEPPCELLRSFYGLTVAESALTRELSNGRSLTEAASRLAITYGTARQRLGTVFAKTDTSRQAELVHLVLTGPENLVGDD